MTHCLQTRSSPANVSARRSAGSIATMMMLALVSLAGPVRAQLLSGPHGAPRMLTFKDVVFRPGQNFSGLDVFPKGARPSVPGSVTMVCTISAQQRLKACKVTSEAPPNMGFGAAAVRFYSFFTVDPVAKDGSPTAGRRISVDMKFASRGGGPSGAPHDTRQMR